MRSSHCTNVWTGAKGSNRITLTKAKESQFCLVLIALFKLRSIRWKLMERILGFLNFCCQLVPIFWSLVRPWYTEWHNSFLNRMVFSHFPCQFLFKVLNSVNLVFSWSRGGNEQSFPVFVDATPFCVAGISGRCCFVRSLSPPSLNFEAELLAIAMGILYHVPFSNFFLHVISDNQAALFASRKGCSRNLDENLILQQAALLYLRSPFSSTFLMFGQIAI